MEFSLTYAKSLGKHPFGDNLIKLDGNIYDNKYDLKHLDNKKDCVYVNLIEKMISPEPDQRPSIKSVLMHPAFWDKHKILEFFQKVSDYLMTKDVNLHSAMEKGFNDVIGSSEWISQLDRIVENDVRKNKFCKYDGKKIRSLLRAIRNYAHHYNEKSSDIKLALGSLDDGFVEYWMSRFPTLLLHVFKAVEPWKQIDDFKQFYCDDFNFA